MAPQRDFADYKVKEWIAFDGIRCHVVELYWYSKISSFAQSSTLIHCAALWISSAII